MGDVQQKKVGMEVTTEKWWWICVGGDDGGGHSIGATSPPTNHSISAWNKLVKRSIGRGGAVEVGWDAEIGGVRGRRSSNMPFCCTKDLQLHQVK